MDPDNPSNEKLLKFRTQFPHTQRNIRYFNHAAQSPLAHVTVEAVNDHLEERHDGMMMTFPKDQEYIQQCRNRIGELIGSPDPRQITFIGNTSEGLNRVTSGIDWHRGDEIILNTMEFPANVYPYRKLEARGVKCVTVIAEDGTVPTDRIASAITPNTRMIAISAVQFLSGYRADLPAIGELCRQHDLLFVVDGIQAAGVMPLDLGTWGVDAFSSGGHKWLMAPTGIGFLYLSKKLCRELKTPDPGWLSVEKPWDLFRYDQPLKSDASRYEGGVVNIPGIYGLNASIGLLLDTGIELIWRQVQSCVDQLRHGLINIGLEPFTTEKEHHASGIVTFHLPEDTDYKNLEKIYQDRGIYLSVREGKIRFAPHGYNTSDEIAGVIDETEEIYSQML